MTTKELSAACGFAPAVEAETREIAGIFTGDLLSWAMGRAKEGDAWFTVMGNVNAVAVAALADCALHRSMPWRGAGRGGENAGGRTGNQYFHHRSARV